MRERLFALVRQTKDLPRVKHFLGAPPEITVGGKDERKLLPWPRVLMIEEQSGGVFLFRFGEDGSFAGDTWHDSMDDAKRQAEYEYGDSLGEWKQMPSGIKDPVAFALSSNL
ncbi:MAG: hypothetical protein EYC68_14960 [Chloroflexota bacterium]|nr:MAG: hypothetical protein EYC68_14960 [Chloroflexota bacterium]